MSSIEQKLSTLRELMDLREALRLRKEELVEQARAPYRDVLDKIEQAAAEIEAEFADQVEDVNERIVETEAQVRADVVTLGQSVKVNGLQAVYMKGRVTWDAKALDGYALGHPELFAFRREGEPSVSLRNVGR
jgi:hypothetical protein